MKMNPFYTRPVALIVSLLFITSCNFIKPPRVKRTPDPKEREYGGMVKSIATYDCNGYWKGNKVVLNREDCFLLKYEEFDMNEVITLEKHWFEDEKDPYKVVKRKANQSGNVLVEEKWETGNPFQGYAKTLYTYNDEGLEIKEEKFVDGSFLYLNETFYDAYNCPVEIIYTHRKKHMGHTIRQEFDHHNRKTRREFLSDGENVTGTKIWKYSGESDQWVYRKELDSDGDVESESDYKELANQNRVPGLYAAKPLFEEYTNIEYYGTGQIKAWSFYSKDGTHSVYQEYDKDGRLTLRKIDEGDRWIDTYKWVYRQDGALLEYTEATSRMLGYEYHETIEKYSVDYNGNWVEKYTYTNDRVTDLEYREIDYYSEL